MPVRQPLGVLNSDPNQKLKCRTGLSMLLLPGALGNKKGKRHHFGLRQPAAAFVQAACCQTISCREVFEVGFHSRLWNGKLQRAAAVQRGQRVANANASQVNWEALRYSLKTNDTIKQGDCPGYDRIPRPPGLRAGRFGRNGRSGRRPDDEPPEDGPPERSPSDLAIFNWRPETQTFCRAKKTSCGMP